MILSGLIDGLRYALIGIGMLLMLSSFQHGPEVLRAEFRCFGRRGVRDAADETAEEVDRVLEVDQRERPGNRTTVGVVDVLVVGERGRREVENVLEGQLVVGDDLRQVAEPLNLLGGLVPGARNEALHLTQRDRQVRQRPVQIGPAVVHARW